MNNTEDDQKPAPPCRPLKKSRSDTFWAMCSNCKMEFEYFRTYLNHTLICFHCRQAFVAVEIQSVSAAGRPKKRKREQIQEVGPCRLIRDLSETETRNMLMEMARKEILSNKTRKREGYCSDLSAGAALMALKRRIIGKGLSAVTTMSVTAPEIQDFDRRRTEKCFRESQVWAAYDNGDGMPRCYAFVDSVESFEPFRIRVSWMNTNCRSTDMASVRWVCSGFMKTIGDFRRGKLVICDSLLSFSHRVKWTEGEGGEIRIFPRKGEVWAVYRNWSPDWNELTPDEVVHKYDMVEVITEDYGGNYDHRRGMAAAAVIPLVKVSGFKAVFRRHLDRAAVRIIPREELFRFSHQVPSVLLTGREGENVLRGCWELDPAATPLELLEVITVSEEEEESLNTPDPGY